MCVCGAWVNCESSELIYKPDSIDLIIQFVLSLQHRETDVHFKNYQANNHNARLSGPLRSTVNQLQLILKSAVTKTKGGLLFFTLTFNILIVYKALHGLA